MSCNICIIFLIIIYISSFTCLAIPILRGEGGDDGPQNGNTLSNSCLGVIVGLFSSVCLILTVGICVCCGKNQYFKWPRRHPRRVLRSSLGNGLGSGHEISIFPPPGIEQYLSASTSNIYFEPLPDITSQLGGNHPSRLSSSVASNLNEDWFAEPHKNFPRNQLQYVRKLGSGWFGQVLEGRAIGVDTDHTSTVITKGPTSKSTPVVVKSLREDASQKEQAFFLQELIPYRDLEHKNILKIVAYCLETQPLLVLLHYCPKGNLKSFLKKEELLCEISSVKMALDVAHGLVYMHEHNFIHTDLAARNCLVDEDLTVKIGDYGFSLQTYQDEYYLAENVALPLRWCAPETLHCTDTTIEARELTTSANVWSFGVLFWEILSRGSLPYEELDEDGIIQKVILERSRTLKVPEQTVMNHKSKLDEILGLCFENVDKRPGMPYLCSLLNNLSRCLEEFSEKEFEGRWNQLKPEEQSLQDQNLLSGNALEMRFESDFNLDGGKSSPTSSLKNLHGSAEDLDARIAAKFGSAIPSWLGLEPGQTMDSLTEEISNAIQRLDEALSEDRSESTTSFSSPEKGSVNFRLGKNSLVLNPPLAARALSDGEEENLTMRLEQGDFSELVRLKSQSVQDFMRLTVVDDGSDSSDKTSQPGSFIADFPTVHHPTQEKNFSSESNLKEAVRDAGFMVELEKLQAEHKFSIISEASREGMSSIEDASRHSEMTPKDFDVNDSMENDNSFLGNDFPSSWVKGNKAISDTASQRVVFEAQNVSGGYLMESKTIQKGETSPDCIVSSRDVLPSAPLPDIIAHDGNVKLSTSSDSSLDEEKTEMSNVQSSIDSTEETFQDIDPAINVHNSTDNIKDSDSVKTSGIFSFDKENCKDELTDTVSSDLLVSISENDAKQIPILDSSFLAEKVVVGQDVIIGALDDYSLEIYKPAKSVDHFPLILNNSDNDNSKDFSPIFNDRSDDRSDFHNPLLESEQKTSLNKTKDENIVEISESSIPQVTNKSFHGSGNESDKKIGDQQSCTSTNFDDSIKKMEDFVSTGSQDEKAKDSGSCVKNISSIDPFVSAHSFSDSIADNELHLSSDLCDKESLALQPSLNVGEIDNKEHLLDDLESSSIDSENLNNCISSQESADENCANLQEVENGEFWELQMAAWQEAAEQTRELLYEAVHPQDSEDDFLDTSKSPESSHKSPFSSTDRLDESDEEGTYVSYDTTDDEAVRFNSDDIDALRSELSLKLGGLGEQSNFTEVENESDMVFVNYKNNSCPSTLSPIKEEAILDFEHYPSSDSSFEFADLSRQEAREKNNLCAEENTMPISPENFKISLPRNENDLDDSYDLINVESRDSLILEDLEYDGSPTQPTVIGPLAPTGSSEDLILVDTLTNKVTLIDSGRPQSHIAFLVEAEKPEDVKFLSDEGVEDSKFVLEGNEKYDDDVDFESLPYEDTSNQFSSLFKSKETCVDELPVIGNIDEEEAPHYQSYFTSALSSISHPTPSLDGNDAFESAEHISLPYDVNLPVMKLPEENVKPGQTFEDLSKPEIKRKYSSESDKEAVILDDPTVEGSFVTLSFLGRLYSDDAETKEEGMDDSENKGLVEDSQNSSMEHFYSTKSGDDSSDNEDIEELLPEPTTPQHEEEPTPKRTPSHLADFVWRGEQDERYTPDWETDSEGNEDVESSSTSGEFIWQPGDPNSNPSMCIPSTDKTSLEWQMANEKIEEEDEEEPTTPVPAEEDEDSESGEEEFTPSTWNRELTPHRSLLKSPENSSGNKKSVHWKRQRHHRVYEYPPEPQSWHAENSNPSPRRSWGSSHSLDYLTLADWELGGDEFLDDNSEDFEFFPKGVRPPTSAPQIYSLAPFAYDKTPEDLFSNSCEFFMGSPGSSYAFSRSSFTPAEFFPSQNSNNYDFYDETNGNTGTEASDSFDPDGKPIPEETRLSREKLRLDLPTLCLSESKSPEGERQNFSL